MFLFAKTATRYLTNKIRTIDTICEYLFALLLVITTGFFCFTTLKALDEYGIRVLYADQWRIYTDYFAKPFPANALALQNGHRPVLSGLFFLLDLYFFGARQNFLLLFGALLASSTAGVMAWSFLRNRSVPVVVKSLAVYIAFTAIFWLGNSRVLFHGNESVHAYLVPFLFLMSVHALLRCQRHPTSDKYDTSNEILWALGACMFSLMALFSFGAGVAAPPTLLLLAFILRLSKTTKAIVMVNILLAAVLYLLLMPSAPKVAGVLISSNHGHNGFTNFFTLLGAPLAFLISGPEALYIPTADLFKHTICPTFGVVGVIILAWRTLSRFIPRNLTSEMEPTAIVMSLFAGGVVLLVTVMRSEYFTTHPDQLFANRYLIWTTLFWGSLGLECLNYFQTAPNPSLKRFGIGFMVLFSIATAIVIHSNNPRWLAHTEKWQNVTNTAAIGLIIGVHDRQKVEQDLIESADKIFALADKLRKKELNIFSGPIAQSIDRSIGDVLSTSAPQKIPANLSIDRTFTDPINRTFSAQVTIQTDGFSLPTVAYLLITNQENNVVGASVLQKHYSATPMAHQITYSGYINDYDPDNTYHVYAAISEQPGG